MAVFNIITFLIHAIAGAMASLLGVVFTHLLPALIALAVVVGIVAVVCTSCSIGSFALLRRRKRQ